MLFIKKLKKVLRENKTHLIVGLDTDKSKIPSVFLSYDNPILEFNKAVIEHTSEYVCGYKLNTAFYEKEGTEGWNALIDTKKYIPDNLITIIDAKRGDIENTSEKYADAFFDFMNYDSLTVSPYMGEDSVRPFLRRKNRFVWLLALTSNYGSRDFQFLKISGRPLWEHVVIKSLGWNSKKIGFVMGANHLKEIDYFTFKFKDVPVLIPGIGAQKNSLSDLMRVLKHNIFLINSSRKIIYPCSPKVSLKDYMNSVTERAKTLRDEINSLSKVSA
ncbi:MAG: orotidine-5'-phosphate decarboxylase [Ignavibacteria bacterium]|nr:orotidine-5'-phosphate decarboxylase [Ignavibacteria bacterium]